MLYGSQHSRAHAIDSRLHVCMHANRAGPAGNSSVQLSRHHMAVSPQPHWSPEQARAPPAVESETRSVTSMSSRKSFFLSMCVLLRRLRTGLTRKRRANRKTLTANSVSPSRGTLVDFQRTRGPRSFAARKSLKSYERPNRSTHTSRLGGDRGKGDARATLYADVQMHERSCAERDAACVESDYLLTGWTRPFLLLHLFTSMRVHARVLYDSCVRPKRESRGRLLPCHRTRPKRRET